MTSVARPGSIVAGVDGSKQANEALRWAAEEARRRGTGVHLLHASNIDWLVAAALISRAEEHPATDDVPDQALDRISTDFPDLTVSAQATTGAAAHDLVVASVDAAEVVGGAHGHAGPHRPLGSVAHAVAMHAACPAIVVRGTAPHAAGPVVVGVDGSPRSANAIDFAIEQAARRGTQLVVLHAWWLEFDEGAVVTTPGSPHWQRTQERLQLNVAEAVAGREEKYPDVEVSTRLVHARPAEALIDASQDAGVVVVGARGRGGFAGLLLGSVSREVLMYAATPVAVVRPG